MIHKSIDTAVPVLPVITRRYSGVSFDPDRQVGREALLALAEAARWAPSCHGDQPWRYIVCDRYLDAEAWERAYACLLEKNQLWCRHAPVLVITCCDTILTKTGKPNAFGPYDTGAASASLSLQAADLGLMTHQMGGFVADKVRELFAVPDRYTPLAMMAIGYQLPEEKIPEAFRVRELAPRVRNPLGEHFFAGAWGKGLQA